MCRIRWLLLLPLMVSTSPEIPLPLINPTLLLTMFRALWPCESIIPLIYKIQWLLCFTSALHSSSLLLSTFSLWFGFLERFHSSTSAAQLNPELDLYKISHHSISRVSLWSFNWIRWFIMIPPNHSSPLDSFTYLFLKPSLENLWIHI